jgi:2'-5' RNA ligase
MTETAVVVPVGEAERVVGDWRRTLTPSGAEGMPAHVTVLTPFADGARLRAGMLEELDAELRRFPRFAFLAARTARFTHPHEVLYLAPEPAEPFVRLTQAVAERIGIPPYEGAYDDVVPHITVACPDDVTILDRVEAELARHLPIAATADRVETWERADGRWRMLHRISLTAAP